MDLPFSISVGPIWTFSSLRVDLLMDALLFHF